MGFACHRPTPVAASIDLTKAPFSPPRLITTPVHKITPTYQRTLLEIFSWVVPRLVSQKMSLFVGWLVLVSNLVNKVVEKVS